MRAAAALLAMLLLLAGCGRASDPGTPEQWLERAQERFDEGEAHAARAEAAAADAARLAWADAVRAWVEAAGHMVRAFRLEEPVPASDTARGNLAFRIGRAWSKAARQGSEPADRDVHADRALFWFDHAAKLLGEARVLDYERALLFDSDIDGVRDPQRARESFGRYLEPTPGAGGDLPGGPSGERGAAMEAHARARLEALAPVAPEDR